MRWMFRLDAAATIVFFYCCSGVRSNQKVQHTTHTFTWLPFLTCTPVLLLSLLTPVATLQAVAGGTCGPDAACVVCTSRALLVAPPGLPKPQAHVQSTLWPARWPPRFPLSSKGENKSEFRAPRHCEDQPDNHPKQSCGCPPSPAHSFLSGSAVSSHVCATKAFGSQIRYTQLPPR